MRRADTTLYWIAIAVFSCTISGAATTGCAPSTNDGGQDGPADVGPADVDQSDGGPIDGGPIDGGPADGGSADGGPADGGSADGGPADVDPADTADSGDADSSGDAAQAPQVEITYFALNGAESDISLIAGEELRVEWEATDADECQAQGDFPGWAGTLATSGDQTLRTDTIEAQGPFSIGIHCSGNDETDQVERTVEITGLCEAVTLLGDVSGWTRTNDAQYPWNSAENQTFEQIFNPWPGTGNNALIGIPKNEFLAASFNSGPLTSDSRGSLRPVIPQGTGSGTVADDVFHVSFSECPGDFDPASPAMPDGCLMRIRAVDNPFWGGPGSGEDCELQANTDYYLNIVYSQDSLGTFPQTQAPCDGQPRCGHQFAPRGGY